MNHFSGQLQKNVDKIPCAVCHKAPEFYMATCGDMPDIQWFVCEKCIKTQRKKLDENDFETVISAVCGLKPRYAEAC